MPISKLRPSFTFTEDRLAELRAVVPEAFADGKVNWEALREALGEYLEDEGAEAEHFGLSWPGKRQARRLAAMPSKGTLVPVPGVGVNEGTTRNIFIEGDNLEVLKLLQKSYAGRVKMIYIDPPYNTGNDFVYKDDFADPLGEYLRATGQAEESGELMTSNPRASGRFHSNWLSMMYPRLQLAKSLLTDDGLIFVSIDDNEVQHLRALMNEVFGEEGFLLCLIWHRRQMADSRNQDRASTDHEYVLAYRNAEAVLRGRDIDVGKYENPDNDPRGPWFSADMTGLATRERRPNLHYNIINPKTGISYPPSSTRGWSISRDTLKRYIEEDRIIWPAKPDGRPRLKKFLRDVTNFQTGFSSMLDVGFTTEGTKEIQELFGEKIIQFPKPVSLIKTLIAQGSSGSDVVLDFFAGSCTTAQAVMQQNADDGGARRYIMVQLPEPIDHRKYATIADIGQERIRRVAKKVGPKKGKRTSPLDTGFRVFKLSASSLTAWQDYTGDDPQQLELLFENAASPLVDGWERGYVLTEIQLLEGFPLDSIVTDLTEYKKNKVQRVESDACAHRLYVCLDKKIKDDTLERLRIEPDDVFVCLDSALTDEAKVRLGDLGNLRVI